jgi:hypothetical protein
VAAGLRAGVAFVDLVPRLTKGFRDEVDRAVGPAVEESGKKAAGAFSGIMRSAVVTVGAGLAIREIGQLVSGSVSAASDLNEAVNVTGLVFKDARGEMDAFAKTGATALGVSETQARQLTAGLGGLLKAMGLSSDETVTWSKKLAVLGADMGSAFNAEPAEAIEAIGSALRGESEPIRRFNVVLSDAAVQAEALSIGLVKAAVDETKVAGVRLKLEQATRAATAANAEHGEGSDKARAAQQKQAEAEAALTKALEGSNVELTDAQKTQARLSILMRQTSDIQGDFANTSDGLANRQRILAARMEDLRAKIGAALLPVVLKLSEVFSEKLLPFFERAANKIAPILRLIQTGFRALFSAFKDGDVTSDGFVGLMERIGVTLRQAWPTIQAVAKVISENLKPALLAAGAAFLIFTSPVTAVVAGLALLYAKSELFRDIVAEVAGFLTKKFGEISKFISSVMPQIEEAISHVLNVIRGIWRVWGDDIGRIVSAVFGQVKTIVDTVLGVIMGVIRTVLALINGDWGKAWEGLKQVVSSVLGGIAGTVKNLLGGLVGIFGGIFDTVRTTIGEKLDGIVSFIGGLPARIAKAAVGMFDGIKEAFKSVINWIIRGWNNLDFKIPGFDPPGPGPEFKGFTLGVPDITELRAAGGPMLPGRSYILGEAGPELLRMGGLAGRTFSNADLFDALGSAHGERSGALVDHLEVKGQDRPAETAREIIRKLGDMQYLLGV